MSSQNGHIYSISSLAKHLPIVYSNYILTIEAWWKLQKMQIRITTLNWSLVIWICFFESDTVSIRVLQFVNKFIQKGHFEEAIHIEIKIWIHCVEAKKAFKKKTFRIDKKKAADKTFSVCYQKKHSSDLVWIKKIVLKYHDQKRWLNNSNWGDM